MDEKFLRLITFCIFLMLSSELNKATKLYGEYMILVQEIKELHEESCRLDKRLERERVD